MLLDPWSSYCYKQYINQIWLLLRTLFYKAPIHQRHVNSKNEQYILKVKCDIQYRIELVAERN